MSFESIGKRETLPEKVCRVIKESILKGEMQGGDALPTEPELESQFGVSRAVIRDAMRMLKAQGLIEVQHGKGMFVTHSQLDAFTDALLTTLRREKATAWDVEQFERIFLPQVFALAAEKASDHDLKQIRSLGERYIEVFSKTFQSDEASDKLIEAFHDFNYAIFHATANKMIKLVGEVLLSLRQFRNVETGDAPDAPMILKLETAYINRYIEALETRDPQKASSMVAEVLSYNEDLAQILKETPVGSKPTVPMDLLLNSYKI